MPEKSTILIVDDDPISQHTVKTLLTPEGYILEFAKSGEEALEKVVNLIPDLMLLDVMMPGMDGFEVCRRLRQNPQSRELPIVMVTALYDRESRLQGLEVGADDFISKPIDQAELRARIRSITRLNRYRRLIETKEQLFRLANYDALTCLPNRQLLTERMHDTLERANQNHHNVAVLVLDLDNFQMINESLGHQIGDNILREVALRLNKTMSGATVARLSSDKFVVMFDTTNFVKEISEIAQRLLKQLSLPMAHDDHEIVMTASIGVSVYPDDSEQATPLLKNAETAMSRAKAAGKNTYQFFTAEMNQEALERLIISNELRKALANNELRLYYQPQIALNSGKIIGMEALLRWQHPEKGLLSPNKFISIAEDMGLIVPIGEWVLRTACQQNKAWQRAGFPPLRVSVNVSSRQFQPHNLLQIIKNALRESGLNPIYLELELTESVLMEEMIDNQKSILELLAELQAMGVKIAMDDFGTGYSSLSYLKHFPFNTLKIDRSFVQDICTNREDAAITTAIIAMAQSLLLSVVAEGVETSEQLAFLRERQCEIGQGYFFSPPISVEEMTQKLQQIDQQPFLATIQRS